MVLRLIFIKYYCELQNWSSDIAPDGIDKLVEKIGAQLGAVEEVIDFGKKYKGILVAKKIDVTRI